MIAARLERMRDLRGFLEGFCAAAGVGRDYSLRLNLVLEELFTNTIKHGHRGDCDAPVWVTLAREGKLVRLTYEDTAPPFNPYAKLAMQSPNTTIGSRKLGGLGLMLTREMASAQDYAYLFGRNRIRMALAAT